MTVEAAPAGRVEDYEQERPARRLTGLPKHLVWIAAALLSAYALIVVFRPAAVLQYRMTFLAVALPLTFLAYRSGLRLPARLPWARASERPTAETTDTEQDTKTDTAGAGRDLPGIFDWVFAAASVAVLVYPLLTFDAFVTRGTDPTAADLAMGVGLTLLLLDATRRTVGRALPVICVVFLLYAYYGSYIPIGWQIGHRGFDITSLVAQLYMGTEGFFGVPLDVAATYIILFTIYGAVLDLSGASRFFIDVSFAAFRKSRSAPGRTITTAGFLLGTVSGSGVATTVSLGPVSWPILRRAGYPPEQA
ncbi:MAG: TRAP transporter large permease subunit, partial [Actinomadura sp.]